MKFHEKFTILRGMNASRFTVDEMALLLGCKINLVESEYKEWTDKIEAIYDKVVLHKIKGKIQEAK